jgi:3-hydroxyacyl-CoA dehydrogenase/enoyl-CoA hydratase/3-hydroxybutyryl-CoA epimerase/3-hydroxyacyl-CoA dehydrogenase/enoyl-CoA hydratase/3-hydroxybutyryl-CoA epimerase/enoyl-CoA isomerase
MIVPESTPNPAATRLEWRPTPAGRWVAVLTLDLPGKSVNLLSSAVMAEIAARLGEVDAKGDAAGIVVQSAKPGVFVAGADITEFLSSLARSKDEVVEACRRGQRLFARLAHGERVSVAAVEGLCLGGGAELAVWCDRIVVAGNDQTQIGWPEVKLGLLPGWGGTARLSRKVGLANAVELVTAGESVDARRAYRMGLADDMVAASASALDAALRMIDAEHDSGAWRRDRARRAVPIDLPEVELAMLAATASAVIQQKTRGRYPAPVTALELMVEAASQTLDEACEAEARAFAAMFGSPVSRALLHVFQLTDGAKKRSKASVPDVGSALVLGAGTMGRAIAATCLKRGVRTLLADASDAPLARGAEAALREASYDKAKQGPCVERTLRMAPLLEQCNRHELARVRLASVEVVIEAIAEVRSSKCALLNSIEREVPYDALLCTNTSTIPIAELARGLARPERFCGLHFFNPVRQMPLVEVIRGPQTSDDTVARAVAFARQLGKTPVVVNDGPGFLVNRLLSPYMAEAVAMVEEGESIEAIDRAAKRLGMPMGPLELHDVVGLDTCLHAGRELSRALPASAAASDLVERLVAAGRLGQKSGGGFYDWEPGKDGKPQRVRSAELGVRTDGAPLAAELLQDRLLLPMLLEATRLLDAGLVASAADIDLALVLGIGFPPFRGGLCYWADTLGAAAIVERLGPLRALGQRFEPTPLLLRLARDNRGFYDKEPRITRLNTDTDGQG